MGIMVVWLAEAPGPTGADPFATKVDVAGAVTHGHLDENSHHGGGPTKLPDPATLPATSVSGPVDIRDFTYALGDFSEGTTQVPTVKPGQAISFTNSDASVGVGIPHTITSCAAPCNGETGVAFPLANGATVFDSGELGTGGAPTADRTTWSTPTNLKPGTYTYFCRIHPFMRGAFRVAT
jgi:plastocyanin